MLESAGFDVVAVEAVAERPDPHVAGHVGRQRIDQQVVAHLSVGQNGQVDERFVFRIENIDAVAGADPDTVAVRETLGAETVNAIVFEGIRPAMVRTVVGEIVRVETIQSVGRADPDIAFFILVKALDGIRREPVVIGVVLEFIFHAISDTEHCHTHHTQAYRIFHLQRHSTSFCTVLYVAFPSCTHSPRA